MKKTLLFVGRFQTPLGVVLAKSSILDLTMDEVLSRMSERSFSIVALMASSGSSREEIRRDYPSIEADEIQASLSYAAWRSEEVDPADPSGPVPEVNRFGN